MVQQKGGSDESEVVADKKELNQTDTIRAVNREIVGLMETACPEFLEWFRPLQRRGANLIDAAVLSSTCDIDGGDETFRVTLFTSRHSYRITLKVPRASWKSDKSGYLGATVSKRMPRAGEPWTRGNDLADGPYCVETWNQIMADILAYELVRLGK